MRPPVLGLKVSSKPGTYIVSSTLAATLQQQHHGGLPPNPFPCVPHGNGFSLGVCLENVLIHEIHIVSVFLPTPQKSKRSPERKVYLRECQSQEQTRRPLRLRLRRRQRYPRRTPRALPSSPLSNRTGTRPVPCRLESAHILSVGSPPRANTRAGPRLLPTS